RLKHNRTSLACGFLEGKTTGHLERNFRTVNFMECAVDNLNLDIHHRITAQHTRLRGFDNPVFNGANVFPRNRAADNLILDHDTAALFTGRDGDDSVSVLPTATRLPDKFAFGLGGLGDRFAIGDLRFARRGADVELAE